RRRKYLIWHDRLHGRHPTESRSAKAQPAPTPWPAPGNAARRTARTPPDPPPGRREAPRHMVRARAREAADHVVGVRRVAVLEVRAGPRGDPFAGDEVLEVLRHERVSSVG